MTDQRRRTRNIVAAGIVFIVMAVLFASFTNTDATPSQYQTDGPAKWRTFDQHWTDQAAQLARGNYVDAEVVNQFGRNPDVDSGTAEDVWQTGGDYVFPTAAETVTIVSNAVNDDGDPVASGLWSLVVYGLDANFDLIEEQIALDGTTPVVTTAAFLRVHLAVGYEAGTGGSNVGTITATQTTSGLPLFTIPPSDGRTSMAIFTVPRDHTLLVTRVYGSIQRQSAGVVGLQYFIRDQSRPDAAFLSIGYAGVHSQGSSWVSIGYTLPGRLQGPTDLKFRALAGANNTDVNAGFDAILIDNR